MPPVQIALHDYAVQIQANWANSAKFCKIHAALQPTARPNRQPAASSFSSPKQYRQILSSSASDIERAAPARSAARHGATADANLPNVVKVLAKSVPFSAVSVPILTKCISFCSIFENQQDHLAFDFDFRMQV